MIFSGHFCKKLAYLTKRNKKNVYMFKRGDYEKITKLSSAILAVG